MEEQPQERIPEQENAVPPSPDQQIDSALGMETKAEAPVPEVGTGPVPDSGDALAAAMSAEAADGPATDGATSIQMPQGPATMRPAEFSELAADGAAVAGKASIDLLLDVSLPVAIELGRTQMTISDILELGTGSIVELDKLAGEPVDILVNNKPLAKGEVVVLDENFGVRITSLVPPRERLANLDVP